MVFRSSRFERKHVQCNPSLLARSHIPLLVDVVKCLVVRELFYCSFRLAPLIKHKFSWWYLCFKVSPSTESSSPKFWRVHCKVQRFFILFIWTKLCRRIWSTFKWTTDKVIDRTRDKLTVYGKNCENKYGHRSVEPIPPFGMRLRLGYECRWDEIKNRATKVPFNVYARIKSLW